MSNRTLDRSPSWRRKSTEAANSWRQEDFGNAESVGGIAGDSSIGMSEAIGANQSTTGSSVNPSINTKRKIAQSDVSYYENDSVMLWSDDPEKEYFAYMLQREQENRARQGKSAEDSLIGDSTLEDIQQEFSKWHQHGGGKIPDPEQDSSLGFPVLSSSHKELPMRPTLDGFSLATEEKSAPKRQQIQVVRPPTPPQSEDNLFPDVIYVTDTPATSVAMSKPSQDTTTVRRRSTWFIVAMFCMGGLGLAAASVAIYMSVTSKEEGNSKTTTSLQEADEEPSWTEAGVPTNTPSLRPSGQGQSSASAPTSSIGAEVAAPTLSPTLPPTAGASAAGPGTPATSPNDTPSSPSTPSFEPPTRTPTAPPSATPGPVHCECKNCHVAIDRIADGFPCGERMSFLQNERGYTELGACRLVAGVEFPSICGPLCDPDRCELASSTVAGAPLTATLAAAQPTPPPNRNPTSRTAELVMRGNNGLPGNAYPLGQCEGDCDSVEQCAQGLVCYQRDSGVPVPGCLNGDLESSETDFCIPAHLAKLPMHEDAGDDFFPQWTTKSELARTSRNP